jgi:hypothetical protein
MGSLHDDPSFFDPFVAACGAMAYMVAVFLLSKGPIYVLVVRSRWFNYVSESYSQKTL